ncbi:MAG: hypothetical protein EWV55_04495 [Microcystis viridis Mv_BB_P_19951000_S69]|uniref:SRPBCC family protein n=1 Tax=Microcystis viridis Mv_BB_P_19951000_S68D TaxID=2486270 RepID=A0A552H8Y1_MICVR|nr:MAG: hypothetical protein EWV77_22140 [Microcystis viridis Mv_BB_P_19951000_S68D]TRU75793.1 MAG: hypothetical protein EWV47_07780 [Microcystis viridis Mv_BB_P_19951000_S68]TRU77620.1 MAG: hypothetical protein EWV55_04495 [Microcystis viridis Mv_BB_P_19951000_S69]TRU88533.1 MAG: hypothetical protein EWV46_05820 [Microcystis viridis Mv_BB_P_19951000_S69D]
MNLTLRNFLNLNMKPCEPEFVAHAQNIKGFEMILKASPMEVFEVVAGKDEEIWFPNFKSMRWLNGSGKCVGAQREYCIKGLSMIENFTIWEPGKKLVFYMSFMSIPYCSRFMEHYEITPITQDQTKLNWRICYEPSWIFWLFFPIVRMIFEADFNQAAMNLENYFAS